MTSDSLLDDLDDSHADPRGSAGGVQMARSKAAARLRAADVYEKALKDIVSHYKDNRFHFVMVCSEIAEKALKQVEEEACGNTLPTSTALTSPKEE